jgi:hypothetical protein
MSTPDWMRELEFTFVATDRRGNLAVVYPREDELPGWIIENWTERLHDQVMPILFDELPARTNAILMNPSAGWAEFDARRGFFVYEFDATRSGYLMVACPESALSLGAVPALALVPRIGGVVFGEGAISRAAMHEMSQQRELAPGRLTRTSG